MAIESTVADMLGSAFWEHWDAFGENGGRENKNMPEGWSPLFHWECSLERVESQNYKGRAKLASWHRLRNCWQVLESLFGFLWCFWCLFFFSPPLTWSQGHCFLRGSSTGVDSLFGVLRNQSLHSHSWPPSWSHLLEAWRWPPWLLATPGFGLLETMDRNVSGSNRRQEETRTFIVAVCWCSCCFKTVWSVFS